MPKHLLLACTLYIGSLLGMAAIAPLYEQGAWRFVTPVLGLAFVAVAVLFMRRSQWTWDYMKWMAVVGVGMNSIFFPTQEFYGAYTKVAQCFSAVEIAASAVILWSLLRQPNTRIWFRKQGLGRTSDALP